MTDTTDNPTLPECVYLMPEMTGGLAEPGGSRTAEYVRADLTRPAPVRVRVLEWHEAEGNYPGQTVWSYDDNQTMWIVQGPKDDKFVWCEIVTIDFAPVSPVRGVFDMLDEAKAAAQDEHNARILAALEPASGVEGLAGQMKGLANWTEALLEQIDATDCNPDDEEAFEEVLIAAQLALRSARAALAAYEERGDG